MKHPQRQKEIYISPQRINSISLRLLEKFSSLPHIALSVSIGLMVSAVSWIVVRRKGEIFEAINMSILYSSLSRFQSAIPIIIIVGDRLIHQSFSWYLLLYINLTTRLTIAVNVPWLMLVGCFLGGDVARKAIN